jgi:hypothetical protein
MQFKHRCFHLAFDDLQRDILCALHHVFDQLLFFLARRIEHEVDHFGAITGMADADAQAPEIFGAEVRA